MWKLKIGEGQGPYSYSTNNFVGRQIWEYDPNAGTPEEHEAINKAREEWNENRKKEFHASGDLFMRMELKKESGIDVLSIAPVRVGEKAEITYETATIAVKKAVRLHPAIQTSDGHWPAENTGSMLFTSPLMMCWWAHDPNGDEFKHHLARVPDYLWLAEDGMKMQSFGSQLWDCALATQAVIASGMVEEYGDCLKKANFYIKESQIKENPRGDFTSMYRHFNKGGWTFSDQDHGWVVADCTAECDLLLLSQVPTEISGEKANVKRLYEAVNVLLYLQSTQSGGFAVWEPAIPQPYLQVLYPSELLADIVVEQQHVECTTSIIQALVSFKGLHPGHREKEIEISVAKASRFLEEKQLPDGSWYGYWGICFLYGTFFALGGLVAAGKTYENSIAVRKEIHTAGRKPDKFGTDIMVNARFYAWWKDQAERDPARLHKAAKLLINAQMDDGDFPQQEITCVCIKNCMLHYAQFRNVLPLWALGEYRK